MGQSVKRWDIFEAALPGPSGGNPFLDVQLEAVFTLGSRQVRVPGFYDGDGTYRIRFMPDSEGAWSYATRSNAAELDGHAGTFACGPPSPNRHGPVSVRAQFH